MTYNDAFTLISLALGIMLFVNLAYAEKELDRINQELNKVKQELNKRQ